MIIDAHCHAWRHWPYASRRLDCTVDALLRTLDTHGVDHALIVAAGIGRPESPSNLDNNEYVAAGVRRYPDRLSLAVEVDGHWSPEYGSAGAAARLDRLVDELPAATVALYPAPQADGWLDQGPGAEVIERAAQLLLPISVAVTPERRDELRAVARRHPGAVFLLHHLGLPRSELLAGRGTGALTTAYGDLDNVYLKLSGLHYAAGPGERPPFEHVHRVVVEPLLDKLGPHRFVWGSDFPAYRDRASYAHALDVLACLDASDHEVTMIAGSTMAGLLGLTW